jgi:hypothetical protein
MNLSFEERRRRLLELAQKHSGLVLASTLLKDNIPENAKAERPIAPGASERGDRQDRDSAAPARRPNPDPGTTHKRRAKRARQSGIQLHLW